MGEPYDQVNFDCTQCGRTFCTENDTGDKSRDGMCNGCTEDADKDGASEE